MEARFFNKLGTVELPGDSFPADTLEAASRGLANRGYRRTAGWVPGMGGIFVAEVEKGEPVLSFADLDRICHALRKSGEETGSAEYLALLSRLRTLREHDMIQIVSNTPDASAL